MKVQQINNQTRFGMEYNIPKSHSVIKKALEGNKKLVQAIDSRYKNARASYVQIEDWEREDYCTVFLLHLNPQKTYRWFLNSHNKNFPDVELYKHLQNLTIEEVESNAEEKHEPLVNISIKKVNPFVRFCKNIYDKILERDTL